MCRSQQAVERSWPECTVRRAHAPIAWSELADIGPVCRYHSVRIDAVHYCDREYDLAQKRRIKPFNGRSGDVRDPAQERLMLFSRTVRENNSLADRVQYLKIPYMMRESSKADLARTVSVLPNLRYVDLPDSFYTSSLASMTLRSELQARCPNIRRMKYMCGAEDSFALLRPGGQWRNLEILELDGLAVESSTLGYVVSSLPALVEIFLVNIPNLDNAALGSLPPVAKVTIKDSAEISIEGIANYFSHPGVDSTLTSLTFTNTSIIPSTLNQILASASQLIHLSISEVVVRPFPITPPPPLASKTLKTLHYELSASTASPRDPCSPSDSYYSYLANSIHAGGLPLLTHLYALSAALPSLLLYPPQPQGHRTTLSHPSNGSFTHSSPQANPFPGVRQTLNLYTKSISELEWNLTRITPPDRRCNPNGSAAKTRPLSLYYPPELSPQWKGTGRESVMVGNGFGGYLMVPGADKYASGDMGVSPTRSPRKKEKDAWMG